MTHQEALNELRKLWSESADPRLTFRIHQVDSHHSIIHITHPDGRAPLEVR